MVLMGLLGLCLVVVAVIIGRNRPAVGRWQRRPEYWTSDEKQMIYEDYNGFNAE